MVDREILERRLRYLEELQADLEGFRSISEEEFVRTKPVRDLAERYLHLAVECMADVGNHILSQRSLAVPDTYKDVFDLLARDGVIGKDLAGRLRRWAGFRNVLVHVDLDIDHRVAWRATQTELADLEEFRRAVANLT